MTDDKVRSQYTIELKNRFQELQELVDDETSNIMYNNIMEAQNKAAELLVPKKE